ncbi:unnamed protein product, partial [Ectocarpus sp. 8 AP-2014]
MIAYNTIIDVCKKCGPWEEAVKLLREMSTPGNGRGGGGGGIGGGGVIIPNVVTYTSAIVACGRSGHWDEALEVRIEKKRISATAVFVP